MLKFTQTCTQIDGQTAGVKGVKEQRAEEAFGTRGDEGRGEEEQE